MCIIGLEFSPFSPLTLLIDRELNVDSCNVTDIGIHLLCGGPREIMGKNDLVGLNGLCESLEELDITDTKITAYGATMALQRLPHLRILAYERIAEAFALMHLKSDHADSAHPEFALTQLDLWGESVISPRQAISLCPLLTHLDIRIVEGVTDSDLMGITALEWLSVFKIWNFCEHSCRITFDGSLAPILKTRGRSLNTLSFVDFSRTFICLATVIEYCPNLEHLTLSNRKNLPDRLDQDLGISRDSKRVNSDFGWKRLKMLILRYCDIMAEVFLSILISSLALEYLTISESSTLTDDVLQRVFQCNSFKNLEMLSLIACPYVTERGINLFLTNENIYFEVKNCGNLVRKG